MVSTTLIEPILGRYHLLGRTAVGGMSEVYRGLDSVSGESVAVKVLLPQHTRNREIQRGIEYEAKLQQAVQHPNLVQLRDFGRQGLNTYLVLEWVEGITLAELIRRCRDLPTAPAGSGLGACATQFIGHKLLGAVSAIHGARAGDGTPLGIVHRDIKPTNVMIGANGLIKLCDFGIARSTQGSVTRTGTVKGSLAYLAPEQATQSMVDARTDLYLVGLLLFELLTGERYLQGSGEIELLRAAEDPPRRIPSEFGHPKAWSALLGKALARFPEERFQSAAAFRDALLQIQKPVYWDALDLPIHPEPESTHELHAVGSASQELGLRAKHLRSSSRRGRHRTLAMGALTGLVVVAGSIAHDGLDYTQSRQPARQSAALSPVVARESVPPPSQAPKASVPVRINRDPPGDSKPKPIRKRPKAVRPRATSEGPTPERLSAAKPTAEDEGSREIVHLGETSDTRDANAVTSVTQSQRELRQARARLKARGISEIDLPSELRERLRAVSCRPERAIQCALETRKLVNVLDTLEIELELVQRRVARLQRSIPRHANAKLKKLCGLALQALFDGRHLEANRYLDKLEAIL